MRRIPVRSIQLALGETVTLPDDAAHYLRDVLRLEIGTRVELFATDGRAFTGLIRNLEPVEVALDAEVDRSSNESPCHVTLYQAVPKQDRFEWVLEKSTELGVTVVVPLATARGVVKIAPAKVTARVERWQRICDSAARQCGRALSPTVTAPRTLGETLRDAQHAVKLYLDPTATLNLVDLEPLRSATDVGVWIGPEGGFDVREAELLSASCTAVRLGGRVLRSETAGIAALTVVQALTGGLS